MGACTSSPAAVEEQQKPAENQQAEKEHRAENDAAVKENIQPTAGGGPEPDDEAAAPAQRMKLKELRMATNDFSEDLVLGEGSFGKVYRGSLPRGNSADWRNKAEPPPPLQIAVKKLNPDSFQGYQEWLAEVLLLERLRHPNLVRLVGYCNEKGEALLVYELCPYGSLEDALFKGFGEERLVLTWAQRVQIAKDITAGLVFLHKQNIIHRDFKASNVLLVEGCRARVTDFGLAKAGPDGNKTHVSTRVMGTMGYLDPTYMSTGRLTKKSDTYALGVTLLELITGRQSMGTDGSESLTTWVRPHLMQRRPDLDALVDPRLEDDYSKLGVVKLSILSKHCINDDPALRPELQVVLDSLEKVDIE